MALSQNLGRAQPVQVETSHNQTSVAVSTQLHNAPITPLHVGTSTSAVSANVSATPSKIAVNRERERLLRSLYPKYLRYNIWREDSFSLSTADWTECASPLPLPPEKEINNPIVSKTISENPSLFKIITPINVDRFEFLLKDHPNKPFVASVC